MAPGPEHEFVNRLSFFALKFAKLEEIFLKKFIGKRIYREKPVTGLCKACQRLKMNI